MPELTISKKTRRQLRELLSKAYAQELSDHLRELSLIFDQWRDNKITCWDLSDHIHQFHNGISRELYNIYNNRGHDIILISRAVARKLIQLDEVPSEVREMISQITQW